tara:strand:+ start:5848 stop:7551 length:1704 start_codon:yes stop_codon:yes gene_type:complete
MNLLRHAWLGAKQRDGGFVRIAPAEIVDANIVDLIMPRADFRGAAYQWLIGLLQTVASPENEADWLDWYEAPPSLERLTELFAPFETAFNLDDSGPRFMQDRDPLDSASLSSVSSLLVDAPGANGVKNNTDFFIKRGVAERLCPDCAAIALYTIQASGPAGGAGFRTGMRGGGPLTTLVLPDAPDSSLWEKLWLNVVPKAKITQKGQQFKAPKAEDATIFPWMGATPTSESAGSAQYPEMLHPLHVYWSMPRRFRLLFEEHTAVCDICGAQSETTVAEVRAKNYGINYEGPWRHPLTPYRHDPKKPDTTPWSQKGRPGGIDYRHWSAFVFDDDERGGAMPAVVVRDYIGAKYPFYLEEFEDGETDAVLSRQARLWVHGFDLDNMKARGWTDIQMPLVAVSGDRRDVLREWVSECVDLAQSTAREVSDRIRHAWFKRPKDASGDTSHLASAFFQATQTDFFVLIRTLRDAVDGEDALNFLPPEAASAWYRALRRAAFRLFDQQALSGAPDLRQMERSVRERRWLSIWLAGGAKKSKKRNAVALFAERGGFDLKARDETRQPAEEITNG